MRGVMEGQYEDGTVDLLCQYADVHGLDGRRVRWCVGVGEEVEAGMVLARCTLPSMSPGLDGASAPGVEMRSEHKGTLVKQLLQEGELITEAGARREECVAACAAAAAVPRRSDGGSNVGTGPAR